MFWFITAIKDIEPVEGITLASLTNVANSDILFLLVPISQLEKCCQEIKPHLASTTLVVDACTVKVYPVSVMKKYISARQPIIATHPLFGPDSAASNKLAGHKIVVCPIRASEKQNLI